MKKTSLATFLLLLIYLPLFACLNGPEFFSKDGPILYRDHHGNVPFGHIFEDSSYYAELSRQIDSVYKKTKNLDYLTEKGLVLILRKHYKEAISLYQSIEQTEPGRYSTASNIGTAYELIGKNDSALKWIKKAIEIDPYSHKRSEWLHVKILEAKLKGDTLFNSQYFLQTDFGNDSIPVSLLNKEKLESLSESISFQLNERISFIKPKDKIIAQLLFDLGNLSFLLHQYNDSYQTFTLAEEYGYEGKILGQRKKLAEWCASQTTENESFVFTERKNNYGLIITASIILALLLLLIWYKRRQRSGEPIDFVG